MHLFSGEQRKPPITRFMGVYTQGNSMPYRLA